LYVEFQIAINSRTEFLRFLVILSKRFGPLGFCGRNVSGYSEICNGNADKTKYIVMSRDQNAGRSHSIKIDNSSIQMVDEFKIFGNNFNKSKFHSGRN
jgi:hypothetical protein